MSSLLEVSIMQYVHKTIPTKSRRMCSVFQCSTYCTKDISLHSFPRDPKLCETWRNLLKISKPVSKYMQVCSLHFTENDYTTTSKLRRLKKKATPSRNIPNSSYLTETPAVNKSEIHRLQECPSDMLEPMLEEGVETEDYENIEKNIVLSQDITGKHDTKMVTLEELAKPEAKPGTSNDCLVENVPFLTNLFSKDKITQTDSFQLPILLNSNEQLMHFTGINRCILKTVTKCAEKIATFNNCDFPDLETRIILVLCKLKINISFACLEVLFGIEKKKFRNIFYSTLSLLAVALKTAIYWPTKKEILNNMPKSFDKFKNTRVVMDCIEIKIPKLKCLKCRVMSYSHYKCTHNIKYLIGITPSGLISFVSSGFGGRASDKEIFIYENVVDKLEVNDAVMVNKDMLIEKECEEKLIKVIRPPFLTEEKQISNGDADITAEIAQARVHVELAIGRIKTFKIFQQLEWYLIPYADEIMTIIAAIINLSPPILPDVRC